MAEQRMEANAIKSVVDMRFKTIKYLTETYQKIYALEVELTKKQAQLLSERTEDYKFASVSLDAPQEVEESLEELMEEVDGLSKSLEAQEMVKELLCESDVLRVPPSKRDVSLDFFLDD